MLQIMILRKRVQYFSFFKKKVVTSLVNSKKVTTASQQNQQDKSNQDLSNWYQAKETKIVKMTKLTASLLYYDFYFNII